jgi:hypothetical protein
MTYPIDMKRLHQGCGESLQSNLPGIPLLRRAPLAECSRGRPRAEGRIRCELTHRRDESDHR